jgi:YVTN family beta-propeller protein
MRSRTLFATCLILAAVTAAHADTTRVGSPDATGACVLPTRQIVRPAGDVLTFPGRPVDLALTPDGRFLFAKHNLGLLAVDVASWKVIATLRTAGASLHGLLVSRDGHRLYATDVGPAVRELTVDAAGTLAPARLLPLDKGAYGCGLALSADGARLYVCQNKLNSVAVIDLAAGAVVGHLPCGLAPYDIRLSPDGATAYVSNWGGRPPRPGDLTANSAGTQVVVDARGVAVGGTVSILDVAAQKELAQLDTGRHAADMALTRDGRLLYVANANDDTVTVIDTAARKARASILVRPEADTPYGSASNALCLSADERTLYVANGGNNAVAVVDVAGLMAARDQAKEENWSGWLLYGLPPGARAVRGFIPSGWYPGAVARFGETLFVANVKGFGSRAGTVPAGAARRVQAALGSLCKVPLPDQATLQRYTEQVMDECLVPRVMAAYEPKRPDQPPRPVPERFGEPSVFRHVIYVIKENRTYDQILGDCGRGESEPKLCQFGAAVTPNQHALTQKFVLLDNYYCNGINSADGHCWACEGNVTDHLEKSVGGYARNYDFGFDALTFSSSGFLWDNVLSHGLSFTSFGESANSKTDPKVPWSELYRRFTQTGAVEGVHFVNDIGIANLARHSVPGYPGWDLGIPDIIRADLFIKDMQRHAADANDPWSNLIIVYLPCDHTGGPPTARAQVADNDLAVGRIVDAVSHSRFWRDTVFFINEDDPQAGVDHIDGHRSPCYVASAYTKRGAVVSEFYNQTSVLHTIEQIFGCPPMNQMDAMAPLMGACFQDQLDLTPFEAVPNQIPLDEMPARRAALHGYAAKLAARVDRIDFSRPDQGTPADLDSLNRWIWHNARGWDEPYPADFAGAHGRGLKSRGLVPEDVAADDDD